MSEVTAPDTETEPVKYTVRALFNFVCAPSFDEETPPSNEHEMDAIIIPRERINEKIRRILFYPRNFLIGILLKPIYYIKKYALYLVGYSFPSCIVRAALSLPLLRIDAASGRIMTAPQGRRLTQRCAPASLGALRANRC